MSRLTEKYEDNSGYTPVVHHFVRKEITLFDFAEQDYDCCVEKLGKLEDIEDELGCPLDVVFRAMEKGVKYIVKIISTYVCEPKTETTRIEHRENLKEIKLIKDVIRGNQYVFIVGYEPSKYGLKEDIVYLKDYQKTWWIKGEKNEKN